MYDTFNCQEFVLMGDSESIAQLAPLVYVYVTLVNLSSNIDHHAFPEREIWLKSTREGNHISNPQVSEGTTRNSERLVDRGFIQGRIFLIWIRGGGGEIFMMICGDLWWFIIIIIPDGYWPICFVWHCVINTIEWWKFPKFKKIEKNQFSRNSLNVLQMFWNMPILIILVFWLNLGDHSLRAFFLDIDNFHKVC